DHMSVTSLTAARATKTLIERVYVAGPVLSGDSEGSLAVLPWRCEIFGVCPDSEFWELTANTHTGCFYYAGPTISACHGASDPKVAQDALRGWGWPAPLFAWIARIDPVVLLAETGAAFTQRKPIFLPFSDRNIADRLYFIEQLADISVVARSAPAAW